MKRPTGMRRPSTPGPARRAAGGVRGRVMHLVLPAGLPRTAAVSAFMLVTLVIGLVIIAPVARTPSSPAPTTTAPGPWTLVLDAEFHGRSLDRTLWTPGWFGDRITGPVKDSCISSSDVSQRGGRLRLAFKARSDQCGGTTRPWTGALVSTNPADGVAGHKGFAFTYGFAEARVEFPASVSADVANWPAWWINGQTWPIDGEIDIAEGLFGKVCLHFHYQGGAFSGGCVPGRWAGRWHVYGVDWEPGSISWYYDGVEIGSTTSDVTSSPMYLVLDNLQGRRGGTTVAPSTMLVDYVRVWQHGP